VYYDARGEDDLLTIDKYKNLPCGNGQRQWSDDLIYLSDKLPIYAKDPSLEARLLCSILDQGLTSKQARVDIKAVNMNTYAGKILTPRVVFYHLACAKYDVLKTVYRYNGPRGIHVGHDPLSEIVTFAAHAWLNTIKLKIMGYAIRRGVRMLVKSSSPLVFPSPPDLQQLAPANSVVRTYTTMRYPSPADIAMEELTAVKEQIRTRNIEGSDLWIHPFAKPLVDDAVYYHHVGCPVVAPLIVSAGFMGFAMLGQGPVGSITFSSPSVSHDCKVPGALHIVSADVPETNPVIHIKSDVQFPEYNALFIHMFTHECSLPKRQD